MFIKFLNRFIKRDRKVFMSGANVDTRSDESKAKDYQFKELVTSAAPVNWVDKPKDQWRSFPIFSQDGSGSCVAQSMAKMMGIIYWLKNNVYVHYSATHLFQRRANKPQSGMAGVDAFKIAQEGVTLEVLTPSQNMTDQQMDATQIEQYKKEVGEVFKIGNYIMLPVGDIETVASVLQVTKKPVMVWFYFDKSEWNNIPIIKNSDLNIGAIKTHRHSVVAVDATLYNGKKALIIEDSWGTWNGFTGQRIITEDFYKARNFFVAYTMNFEFDEIPANKPNHIFYGTMDFGQRSDEIKVLQDILKYEQLFPLNVESTGYFGSITQKAVKEFQQRYKIASVGVPGFGRVGPLTRDQLNRLYS